MGEGTYGVVFRAKDKITGDIVAIKKIRLESDEEGWVQPSAPVMLLLKLSPTRVPRVQENNSACCANSLACLLAPSADPMHIALTTLMPRVPSTALREMAALKELDHPNVVKWVALPSSLSDPANIPIAHHLACPVCCPSVALHF